MSKLSAFNVKRLLFAYLCISFLSCENNARNELVILSEPIGSSENITGINLDSITDYNQLLHQLKSIACSGNRPMIIAENNEHSLNIYPWYLCPNENIINCSFLRNELWIRSDSIYPYIGLSYPIDSLTSVMRRHYLNDGADFRYADSAEKASLIYCFEKDDSGDKIKAVIIDVIQAFNAIHNKVNDTILINMNFESIPFFEIPPPPPPPPSL